MGSNGLCSDTQIFNKCQLKQSIFDKTIGFLGLNPILVDDRDMSYFIVYDYAFALKTVFRKKSNL